MEKAQFLLVKLTISMAIFNSKLLVITGGYILVQHARDLSHQNGGFLANHNGIFSQPQYCVFFFCQQVEDQKRDD